MLQDKQLALEFLMDSKTNIVELTKAALESSNSQLKQTLVQMRNQAEQTHEEIYQIAERTGAYISAAPADHKHVQRIAQFFQQNMNNIQNQGYFGGEQYTTAGQGSYQNTQGYGANVGSQYQGGTSYYENVDPLKTQGSQYYKNKN